MGQGRGGPAGQRARGGGGLRAGAGAGRPGGAGAGGDRPALRAVLRAGHLVRRRRLDRRAGPPATVPDRGARRGAVLVHPRRGRRGGHRGGHRARPSGRLQHLRRRARAPARVAPGLRPGAGRQAAAARPGAAGPDGGGRDGGPGGHRDAGRRQRQGARGAGVEPALSQLARGLPGRPGGVVAVDPLPVRRRRLLALGVAVLAAAGLAAGLAIGLGGGGTTQRPLVGTGRPARSIDPLAYSPGLDSDLVRRATAGYSHVLYAKSPGGVTATARRVAAWRPQVERAAASSGGIADADTLEAIVFLESGGRPDVIAGGSDPANAAGLTQIVAQTGQSLLGMRIDLARSRSLTARARRELARGHPHAAAVALAARRRADPRFDPVAALGATIRYLKIARGRLGRDDLTVVSYHMGIGNLRAVLADYGESQPSYVRAFFDSSPLRHAAAWRLLASFGDDSSTYWWRVLAAKEIMRLYRHDPSQLARLDELQTNKASAEEVLHPAESTAVFRTPGDVAAG